MSAVRCECRNCGYGKADNPRDWCDHCGLIDWHIRCASCGATLGDAYCSICCSLAPLKVMRLGRVALNQRRVFSYEVRNWGGKEVQVRFEPPPGVKLSRDTAVVPPMGCFRIDGIADASALGEGSHLLPVVINGPLHHILTLRIRVVGGNAPGREGEVVAGVAESLTPANRSLWRRCPPTPPQLSEFSRRRSSARLTIAASPRSTAIPIAEVERQLRSAEDDAILSTLYGQMRLVAMEGEQPFLVVALPGPFPIFSGGLLDFLPPRPLGVGLSEWLERAGMPSRADLKRLLAAYGLRLPTEAQVRNALISGLAWPKKLSFWMREHQEDVHRLDQSGAKWATMRTVLSAPNLGVIAVREPPQGRPVT